jgi:predicted GIY-YIG superfamily endonuclease
MNKTIIYTVYELKEDLSPVGKPYIGSTKRIKVRAGEHKRRLKLSYTPILYPIQEFSNKKEAYKFEQRLRVQNGWKSEDELNSEAAKIGGKKAHELKVGIFGMSEEARFKASSKAGKKILENGTGLFGMSEEDKFESRSKAGKMTKGKIWINDGNINKMIYPDNLQTYQQLGFSSGRK